MDPSGRKINTAKFQLKKVSVLIVTDVAARGIDIPSLDYVINLHFPGKPKLFVHRVGRCARAGRSGTAYSIVSTDDEAHLIDLHLFLNRPFDIDNRDNIGIVPPDVLEDEHSKVMDCLANQHIVSVENSNILLIRKQSTAQLSLINKHAIIFSGWSFSNKCECIQEVFKHTAASISRFK